ncbi:RNA-binding protein [Defluviitalea saccharophila]|uniref:YlmH/Sll1252 family protein n=1 Tax=Defluviitalea saccharophila TaxID=879970 RepID=A0ABZ2Y609_9FIRM
MINKEVYLKNFNDVEERLTASKILDRANIALRDHVSTFTDFIDMYKLSKFLSLVHNLSDLTIKAFGGYSESERKIIGFCPEYRELEEKDFPIAPIEVLLKSPKEEAISHRDYLGSILGLGIERSKIGDILVYEQKAVVFVYKDIASYIVNNLSKIKSVKAEAKEILLEDIIPPQPKIKEIASTVSSLRADSILSAGFQLSRNKIVDLIKSEKALINGTIASPSSHIKEGDFLTLRGFGKIKLVEVRGKTKKDRMSIVIHRYV